MRTFASSADAISYLQATYGSSNYNSWQVTRWQFFSFSPFASAGVGQLPLFGNVAGVAGATQQLTNIPKANSFGQQHFLVKAIRCAYQINDPKFAETNYLGTDATTFASEIVNGIFQSGYLELSILAKPFLQLPLPFLMAPPASGDSILLTNGLTAAVIGNRPVAELNGDRDDLFLLEPEILIEAENNFSISYNWPSGVVPLIATSIVNDATNPLNLGVILDGILFRPTQ